MSMNLNKVMLAGRLTRDPDLKQLPNGNSVTNLGFVTNRVYKSGDQRKEEATFLEVKAWGANGETITKYLKKGSPIFIEGRLTGENWKDTNGEPRSKMVVTMENYKFINEGGNGNGKAKEEKKDDLGF